MRILFDPTATEGGAPPAAAPAPGSPPAAAPQGHVLTADEYKALMTLKAERDQALADKQKADADKARADADRERAAREAREKEIAALAKAGDTEKAFAAFREQNAAEAAERDRQTNERIRALETRATEATEALHRQLTETQNQLRDRQVRAQKFALEGEIGRALASQSLVPGGAEQLSTLWKSQNVFSVAEEGESFAVRATGGQPVADFIAAQLGRPEYAHFLRPSTQGGTAAGQPIQSPHTPPANPGANLTAEQQFAATVAANPNMTMGEKLELAGKLKIYGSHAPQPTAPQTGEGGRPILAGFGMRKLV